MEGGGPGETGWGMRRWGGGHAGAVEVGAVMGMRPWGYMHAGAVEVVGVRRLAWEGGHGDMCMRGLWK